MLQTQPTHKFPLGGGTVPWDPYPKVVTSLQPTFCRHSRSLRRAALCARAPPRRMAGPAIPCMVALQTQRLSSWTAPPIKNAGYQPVSTRSQKKYYIHNKCPPREAKKEAKEKSAARETVAIQNAPQLER